MYKIFDLHNDFFVEIKKDKKKISYLNKQLLAENIISTIWTSEMDERQTFSLLDKARDFVNSDEKLLMGVEDLHFLSKENVDDFIAYRPAYAGLTWNTCNAIAGGAKESGRLTSFGKNVIKKLEENYIQVDLAHLNENSFVDVAKYSTKPLFCSHSACYSLVNNPRNLKDYQIKMICETGGLFGLCLVGDFISGENTTCLIQDLVCHIDYFACHFGIDNLAIGTDFFGTKNLPRGVKNYKSLIEQISLNLKKLGYTEKAISKIFFENAHKFFMAN